MRALAQGRGTLAALVALVAGSWLAGHLLPPYATSRDSLLPPGPGHWLGTNDIGQDVLTGLIVATPPTVGIALATAALSMALSTLAALPTGRLASAAVLRLVDILLVIPSILILLLLAALIQPGLLGIVLLLALTTWHDDVRVLRSLLLRETTRENVQHARAMGAGRAWCLHQHILPALAPALMGLYVQNVRQAAMRTAGLAFLGLTDPRLTTWGSMMQDALNYLYSDAWTWLLLPPVLCLSGFLWLVLRAGRALERRAMALPNEAA